ncbi:CHAD domain-containing protein [Porticoccus sp.]|uniref:CHAD domain-containing protein n=1 Tax=Porticoccus sp. TaxID=2024853 RepID=UPI003F69DB95
MDNFVFQTGDLSAEFNRVVLQQTRSAREQLQSLTSTQLEGIHEARKCFKRLRACYRLLKSADKVTFRQGNQFFRDLPAKLSVLRDTEVMSETLLSLRADNHGLVDTAVFDQLERQLALQQPETITEAMTQSQLVSDQLGQFLRRYKQAEQPTLDANVLLRALVKSYAVARRSWKQARYSGDDDDCHYWRKCAKYYWYQLRLISVLCPPPKKQLNSLERLCSLLGDYHDLAVLKVQLTRVATAEQPLQTVIAQRQRQLFREADDLAESLFKRRANHYNVWLTKRWHRIIP